MLAKDLKIKHIKLQREFLISVFNNMLNYPNGNGNTAYVYEGYIFPEVIAYFQKEGFRINEITSDAKSTACYPSYLFTISDDISLSENDQKAAEDINCSSENISIFSLPLSNYIIP